MLFRSYLRAALSWCLEKEIIPANPAAGIKKPAPATERDRALSDDEIRAFGLACDSLAGAFGPFLKMLLLTGQRRGELAGATWSEFDLDRALWSAKQANQERAAPRRPPCTASPCHSGWPATAR